MIGSVAAQTLKPFFEQCMIQPEESGGQDVLRFDSSLVSNSKNRDYFTDEMILEQSKNQRFALLLQCVESRHLREIYGILTKKSEWTPTEKWERIQSVLRNVELSTVAET